MSGLAVRAAAAVRAPEAREPDDRAAALGYFHDLLAPFGEKPDEELFDGGRHVRHRDLADLLVADEGVGASRPELLIVAHALPDVVPFTAVAPYLTERLGGRAANFAIAQQGLAAPFTALRIASAYARAGRAAEVVIAVLEQTTLPTPFPLVRDTPLVDSAVALVLGTSSAGEEGGSRSSSAGQGDGPRFVRAHAAGSAADALGRELGEDGTLLVLGPWVTGDLPAHGGPVHRAAPGSYCTGVWLDLADHWREWGREHRRIVLCDTDPRSGRTHVALFAGGGA
ncbi:hypothetical protein [Streptomyces sp. NPDC088757]|uniref:hypothetical protein n=1 Tax=Streptomyces sp. NPDC088757 TaxID=3365889 RepID=UPI00382B18ED